MTLRFIVLAAIVAMNAFFAAAEVSLVAVRRSRLKELAARNSVPARAALELLANPERLLSLTQIGVTLASLGLGWAGENTLYRAILAALGPLVTARDAPYLHAASFALGFLAMSYFHVVLGEVAPKNLAIVKADRLALLVAPVLLVFYRLALPFVYVVERSAQGVSRVLGIHSAAAGGHSTEELKLILESSRRAGHLEGFEEIAIQKLLELHDVSAREIMTPRVDIVSASVDASLDDLLRLAIEHKYSRIPVYEDKPEHIIGIVHFKDLLRAWQERKVANDRRLPSPPFRLRRYLREPIVVPETKPLSQLVDEFRGHHAHMAMVLDEFGQVTGLVTLEDVLEQVFGEIGDEHDIRRPKPVLGAPVIELEGGVNIRDLASEYGINLPGDAGFETLAGFLLFRLGYIPTPGDSITYNGRTFIVQQMDRNRIARVKIVAARPPDGQAPGDMRKAEPK
ncbi:MAG TPA: hemolysin family protein [Bryobacteraceae bacterium]|nr:hemolysin family protein [Bryobacteraceae bacterium]